MKTLLLIVMLISIIHAFQSEKEIKIASHSFTAVEASYNEYGEQGITMILYAKGDIHKKEEKLLFLLKNESGACLDKDGEKGTYSIDNDSITLYTHWKRSSNSNNAPIGNRIQVYKVDKNGSFYMSDSALYVETHSRNDNDGMKYLYTEAKTKNEKKLLVKYIERVEHIFKTTFVMGDKAEALAAQVSNALAKNLFQY